MKKYYIGLILTLSIVLLGNCTKSKKNSDTTTSPKSEYKEAFDIINQNCISCHSPKVNAENKIAPSLLSIKEYYKKNKVTEGEFTKGMVHFLLNPKTESAIMSDEVKRFGLMPKLGYSEEQYKAIASYLFHTEISDSDWLKKEKSKFSEKKDGTSENYLKKGLNLALFTKGVLGKNLLHAIKTKGTPNALVFCNERATFLTDSMATNLNAHIRRVSDKNRNPNNVPNESELKYILDSKEKLKNNISLKPQIHEKETKVTAYYPIMTNEMCLQCHGKPNSDIKLETLNEIEKLYPNDKALNYGTNELRGIWVIKMNK